MTRRRYAEDTTVSIERSRVEIERLLVRYGATAFAFAWEGTASMISFRLQDRYVRIVVPSPSSSEVGKTATGRKRSSQAMQNAYDQELRRRWRAQVLIIKAKLEAIESGITTLEKEFLGDIVLPNNQTVGQWLAPQIAQAYESGRMPPLLPTPELT